MIRGAAGRGAIKSGVLKYRKKDDILYLMWKTWVQSIFLLILEPLVIQWN